MLRNALLPVVTIIGLQLGLLLSGAVLTETVFAFAGIGQVRVRGDPTGTTRSSRASSWSSRSSYVIVNLVVDISYGLIDPQGEGPMSVGEPTAGGRRGSTRDRRAERRRRRQPGREAWRRLRRDPVAIIGSVLVLVFVLVAIFAPLARAVRPERPAGSARSRPTDIPGPSAEHRLGPRPAGRDELAGSSTAPGSRCWSASCRWSSACRSGMLLGLLAGAFGGWVDNVVMRIVDIMLSIPGLLFAIGDRGDARPEPARR